MLDSVETQVFDAALALPRELRAQLANKLQDSLAADGDLNDRAKLLQQHFHEAKQIAIRRATECQLPATADGGG